MAVTVQGTLEALCAASYRSPIGICLRCYVRLEYEVKVLTALDMRVHRRMTLQCATGNLDGIVILIICQVFKTQVIEVLEHIQLILGSKFRIRIVKLIVGYVYLTVALHVRMIHIHTIHKSQGLTFDRAIIDASLSFAPGQVYVALSRCKTLNGMVLASQIPPHAIINDDRVDSYIEHQEEAAQRSIEQLPTLKDEYYRYLLMELFDFKDILYREEYLSRIITEFFYHSFTDIAELHKRALEDFKKQVIVVADKWLIKIQQMTIDTLREEEFLERVKRSAAYFEQTLDQVLTKPLGLVPNIQSNNKQAMKRLTDNFVDLRQAWLSRRYLLQQMTERTFTIADYLRQKQHSLLDAMDEQTLKKKKRKRKKK